MEKTNEYWLNMGVRWEPYSARLSAYKGLQRKIVDKLHDAYFGEEGSPWEKIEKSIQQFGHFLIVDKNKFFQRIGKPEWADKFPLETMTKCVFSFDTYSDEVHLAWEMTDYAVAEKIGFYEKTDKIYRMESLFGHQEKALEAADQRSLEQMKLWKERLEKQPLKKWFLWDVLSFSVLEYELEGREINE